MKLISNFFQDERKTAIHQVIGSFTFGVLLSPWGQGIFFLAGFIIIYEIFFYLFTHGDPRYYNVFVRTGVTMASILGFIIGRTVSNVKILKCGVPWMNSEETVDDNSEFLE
jgi:hypothetical protein